MAATIDTLRLAKRFREAGAPEPLAEVFADAFREQREAGLAQLATKADLEALRLSTKADLAEAKAEIVKWTVGVGLVQGLALIGALFAFLRFLPGGTP